MGRMLCLRDQRALTSTIMLAAVSGTAMADFTFNDFGDTGDLNLLGDAAVGGSGDLKTLAITDGPFQTSSIWYMDKQNVTEQWSTEFSFTVTDLNITGADGFAFVVQNTSENMHEDSSFGQGGGIGYNMGSNLLAVEFDMWENERANDPNANHISIQNAGPGITSSHQDDSLGVASDILDMSSGEIIHVLIDYEPGTMTVSLNDELVLEAQVDMESALDSDGTAWVGFTGAGTAAWQTNEVHNWNFETVPAPASVALLGMGMLGISRRRR